MTKLLAVDLDGTLFYPKQLNRRIPKKNVKFLQHWIDEGNKLVLITSRSYEFTEQLKNEINRPFDTINYIGGQIRIDEKLVKDTSMNNETISKILDDIREEYNTLGYMLTSDVHPAMLRDNKGLGTLVSIFYKLWYFFQGKYRERYTVNTAEFDKAILKEKIYIARIFFGVRNNKKKVAMDLNKSLRTKFPEIESSWTDLIIELTPKGCNKAEALAYYVNEAGFKKEDVYVVGDSGNDITMFAKYHGHSYCMAHSYPSVKKYAKNVISRVYKLDKLLLKGE